MGGQARKLHLNEINTHSNLDRTSTVLAARAETATVAETHSNVPDCPSAIASSSARRRGSNAHEASQKTQMVPKQAERGQSNRRVQQDASRMRDHGEDDHIEAVAAATAALTASVVARDVSGGEVVKKAETGAIRAKEVRRSLQCLECLPCLQCLLLSMQRSVVDVASLFVTLRWFTARVRAHRENRKTSEVLTPRRTRIRRLRDDNWQDASGKSLQRA
eukprot:COSAG02_NODE_2069_length_9940_cov_3.101819_3_plen_219_part_00